MKETGGPLFILLAIVILCQLDVDAMTWLTHGGALVVRFAAAFAVGVLTAWLFSLLREQGSQAFVRVAASIVREHGSVVLLYPNGSRIRMERLRNKADQEPLSAIELEASP